MFLCLSENEVLVSRQQKDQMRVYSANVCWHRTQVECLKAKKRAEKCFPLIWKRMIKSFRLLKLIPSNRLNRRWGISAAEKVSREEKKIYFTSIWQLIKIATFSFSRVCF